MAVDFVEPVGGTRLRECKWVRSVQSFEARHIFFATASAGYEHALPPNPPTVTRRLDPRRFFAVNAPARPPRPQHARRMGSASCGSCLACAVTPAAGKLCQSPGMLWRRSQGAALFKGYKPASQWWFLAGYVMKCCTTCLKTISKQAVTCEVDRQLAQCSGCPSLSELAQNVGTFFWGEVRQVEPDGWAAAQGAIPRIIHNLAVCGDVPFRLELWRMFGVFAAIIMGRTCNKLVWLQEMLFHDARTLCLRNALFLDAEASLKATS